ncbi:c-type cytochrome [Hyphomonas johnsonii]|uniref:Cytochrome c family protein n=1 Tax=Hyphomonas johnsonii MHS-2 TaxID=1280950 RepID=A0A059FFS8_9PROT|nr:cytochrome c family protein [Hyphomonas johnsonii]KCZ89485.1 cytochrome c family protein [Hyphomonas johnsonii MHS-2]
MSRLLKSAAALSAIALVAACGGSGSDAAPSSAAEAPAPASKPAPATTPAPEPAADTAAAPAATPAAAPAAAPGAPSPEFANLPAPYNTADYARGRRTFKLCSSCHLDKEGAGNLVGPNLYGLFNRKVGTEPGFAYSDALKNADFTWTPDHVDEWLTNPREYLRGNRMSFAGVRKPEDRLALIAYLMTETGYEPPAE